MKFTGDIIITDPCYIIRENPNKRPTFGQYGLPESICSKRFADFTDEEKEKYRKYKSDPYFKWNKENDDWDKCGCGDCMEALGITTYISEFTLYGDWGCTTYSTPRDPQQVVDGIYCEEANKLYESNKDDWQKKVDEICEGSKEIGSFCADAGMVAVFLLDEVKKYNPDFDWYESRPWTTTLIPNFDGEVKYYVDELGDAHIIGKGNINFFTTQTSL